MTALDESLVTNIALGFASSQAVYFIETRSSALSNTYMHYIQYTHNDGGLLTMILFVTVVSALQDIVFLMSCRPG